MQDEKSAMVSTDKRNITEPGIAAPEFAATHPAWLRLEDQMQWYDNKSQHSQHWYKRLKLAQVALAVLIPVMSLLPADISQWAMALSGTVIALLEAVQQMNQYSTLWVTYRATAGKQTTLLAHQTPLHGEHSRLSGCPRLVDHYRPPSGRR